VPWEFCPYQTLLFHLSKFGRSKYIDWIERQRRIRRSSKTPAIQKPEQTSGRTPRQDDDGTIASEVDLIDFSSPSPPPSVIMDDEVTETNDTESIATESSTGFPVNTNSRTDACSWTLEEAAIPDEDLQRMDTSEPPWAVPEDYFCRARRLPRTAAHCMTEMYEKSARLEGGKVDPNIVITTHVPLAVPHDPLRDGLYKDKELFITEEHAGQFLESSDLAALLELACPFHVVVSQSC